MLEQGEGLATWQCPVNPVVLSVGQSVLCQKLPDHRRAYLAYEGPVRRGRGEIQRIEEGQYECISVHPRRRRVQLHGQNIRHLLELQKTSDGWLLTRLTEENFA